MALPHSNPHKRTDVAEHLRVHHDWSTSTVPGIPGEDMRLGDGRYFFETSELLAIHRELHLIETLGQP